MALGDCCAICGAVDKLQFDHIDPKTKIRTIANILAYREDKFWAEVAKCQLLCIPCHTDKTIIDRGMKHAVHGGTAMYRRGCRCRPCVTAASVYHRQWKYRKKLGRVAKLGRLQTANLDIVSSNLTSPSKPHQ
jgi:hypothetical protein